MDNRQKKKLLTYIPFLAVTALAVLGIINISWLINVITMAVKIVSPLIIGAVLAYILNLIMKKVEKLYFPNSQNQAVKLSRRPICLIVSLLLVIILLTLVFALIVPEIANIFVVLGETLPIYAERIKAFLLEYEDQIPIVGDYIAEYLSTASIDWNSILEKTIDFAKTGVGGLLSSTLNVISTVAGGVINFFIGLIFSIYILFNKEKLSSQLKRIMKSYLKPKINDRILYFTSTVDKCFSSFIVGQCTEAVILGVLCAVGMSILKIPYATTIGTLIGATAFIPIVGAYIGAIVGALMILVVDPLKALWFIIFLVILQQVEGNVIYPKVVGSSIGLPGMWVLAAVTVGGGLGGVFGMLVGVPVAATIYRLVANDVQKRERENEITLEPLPVTDEAQPPDNPENQQQDSSHDSGNSH